MTEDRTPPEADAEEGDADEPDETRETPTAGADVESQDGEEAGRRAESVDAVDDPDGPDADPGRPPEQVDESEAADRDSTRSTRERDSPETADDGADSARDADGGSLGADGVSEDAGVDAASSADRGVDEGDSGVDEQVDSDGDRAGASSRQPGTESAAGSASTDDDRGHARSVAAGASTTGTAAGATGRSVEEERTEGTERAEGAGVGVDGTTAVGGEAATDESDVGDLPADVRSYDRFQKVDRASYDRVNEFLRDRTYITAREWAIARLCADFRTATGVEMTKIGENLPHLVPFMTDTYTPQAVNQARSAFEEKVRMAGATFLYGAMSGFFTADELDDLMYEVTEVAKFLLEVEGVELAVEEELDAEDRISAVMREVRQASEELRYEEVACPHCGEAFQPAEE